MFLLKRGDCSIGLGLVYSKASQSHVQTHRLFSITGSCKTPNIAPCARREVFAVYFTRGGGYLLIPNSSFILLSFPFGDHKFVSVSVHLLLFCVEVHLYPCFLDSV